MGKYDEIIGNFVIKINVDDILEEEGKANSERITLAERLCILVEEDIKCRQKPLFVNEKWANDDIEYYKQFKLYLMEYIEHIKGTEQ